ncbi:MAG: acetyl-CoA C-acyltransferase FadI, partial [Moraxellaceae bacterium]|nr:acetyl-CoA C-acyltransferase FadI [Moraxellaceae bacterium]
MNQRQHLHNYRGRIAIVDGLRTPFARIATHYRDLSAIDLGAIAVKELMQRNALQAKDIDQLVYGMTVMIPEAPFIAREVALQLGMDDVDAYSITRACATSFQTVASAAESILAGSANVVIAGGTDSTSSVRLPMSPHFSATLRDVSFAKTLPQRLKLLAKLRASDLLPQQPSITEFSVGETMGQSTEKMVKKWGISRAEQDDLAHASHSNAANAWQEGRMDKQVMRVDLASGPLKNDNLVRKQSVRSSYDKLRPVFDAEHGSVTAGNSSPLTDGASALLLMCEAQARAEGREVLGYIRSFAFAAKTPQDDLLMGPVHAAPLALDRAGISLNDLTIIDMHEAFAGQVACNLKGLASDEYARTVLGRNKAVGEINRDILNVNGGSLAFGHPFGATGARVIAQTLYELKRRGGGLSLTTACAAGGRVAG